jgi:hypothetical protein
MELVGQLVSYLLCIYCSFNDTVGSLDYTALNGKLISE